MPTYTYRCDSCGVQFDHRQSFSDPILEICPECSEKTIHKVYTPVGIVFKGSGFYATDNRSPSGQKSKKSSSDSSTTSSSETSKSESSSESSAETSKNETPSNKTKTSDK